MTDSMKFGPEWLRNLSTDPTANTSIGSSGGSSGNSFNTNSLSTVSSYVNSASNNHLARQQRNMFPHFRYGREELLSLFDKSCNLPEILPSYKKLFVDKVQVPLALTPSTDEDFFSQVTVPSAQRLTWMKRSPVGFLPASRGTGRGNVSVDRGRIRGKYIYHPVYQRSTTMFDPDEMRPSAKERSWTERNGGGDTQNSGAGGLIGTIVSDWNGTPTSSPRKEFSSHSRNIENWRKNRIEDGSGDSTTTVTCADGWRGLSSYSNTHKWGRSTSWRDEECTAAGGGDGFVGSFAGTTMQRSNSALSTSVNERTSYGGSLSKSSSLTSATVYVNCAHISNRQTNANSAPTGSGVRNQWATSGNDPTDELPEWATENLSDSSGTFDASGAFHRSIDEESSVGGKDFPCSPALTKSALCANKPLSREKASRNVFDRIRLDGEKNALGTEKLKSPITKEREGFYTTEAGQLRFLKESKKQEETYSKSEEVDEVPSTLIEFHNSGKTADSSKSVQSDGPMNKSGAIARKSAIQQHILITNSQSDLSDRMQEVADDMVEKLIMDDDSLGSRIVNGSKIGKPVRATSSATESGIFSSFVSPTVAAIMKQSVGAQQPGLTASPSLPTLVVNQKEIPLYEGALFVDHVTMQQRHQQQQLANASAAVDLHSTLNSASIVDLWYYRDPQSKVQGPFNATEMTEWYRAGYFDENLFVRRVCDTHFRALGELIKLCHGNMPFTHTHLIPTCVDRVDITADSVTTVKQVMDKQQPHVDFALNIQQHQEHREEFKGNVTTTADSLSATVKNLINPVDVSHMLNVHFQLLQEQYLRHQEMMIVDEYSTNQCFQRLTPSEREAVIRQKVQILGLPEYLTSLSALSNSLASLNPSAGSQFYGVITDCSKKQPHFGGNTSQTQPQEQQLEAQQVTANLFMDRDDFSSNMQKQHQQKQSEQYSNVPYGESGAASNIPNIHSEGISANELINDFNLRMLLCNNITNQKGQQVKLPAMEYGPTNISNNLLTQQQLIEAASQNSAMQMWMSQLSAANCMQSPQFFPTQPQIQGTANQWSGNPLVQLPNTNSPVTMAGMVPIKPMPASMWDVLPLESVHNHFHHNVLNFDGQTAHDQTKPEQTQQENTAKDEHQGQHEQHTDTDNMSSSSHKVNPVHTLQVVERSSSPVKQTTLSTRSNQEVRNEKQACTNKRTSNKIQNSQSLKKESKEETITNKKQSEEDRRRKIADERRRLKEEKKRLQVDEDKRRQQLIEDEKQRQIIEEKDRQHQIQAQRRKAMLGTTSGNTSTSTAQVKSLKDQRIQSSIAPWSAQNVAIVNTLGPSLAEIQKAERRERRADQQRQMEILEKKIRDNAATSADISDAFLKWNASPVLAKSFAEIQAEEAKSLAAEQLEIQRRKEQEHAASLVADIVGGGQNAVSSSVTSRNISAIWSGSKVWGSTSNAGFWEEPIKFSTALAANNTLIATSANSGAGSQSVAQHKVAISSNQNNTALSNRNLMKSQTVSTMQNTSSSTTISNIKNNPMFSSSTAGKQSPNQPQKCYIEKKICNSKNENSHISSNNGSAASSNKIDDYQNEFTGWCMKSLRGMNTKVDVPTFVTFLQDLESPYEVKDYVRMYLGESKEYLEFAKQFLERRSKYKSLQRAKYAHIDDMCKPAPAITPSNDPLDNKSKQKKMKKSKMTKLDARILGFSVTAAEGRINVGDRDYVDGP